MARRHRAFQRYARTEVRRLSDFRHLGHSLARFRLGTTLSREVDLGIVRGGCLRRRVAPTRLGPRVVQHGRCSRRPKSSACRASQLGHPVPASRRASARLVRWTVRVRQQPAELHVGFGLGWNLSAGAMLLGLVRVPIHLPLRSKAPAGPRHWFANPEARLMRACREIASDRCHSAHGPPLRPVGPIRAGGFRRPARVVPLRLLRPSKRLRGCPVAFSSGRSDGRFGSRT